MKNYAGSACQRLRLRKFEASSGDAAGGRLGDDYAPLGGAGRRSEPRSFGAGIDLAAPGQDVQPLIVARWVDAQEPVFLRAGRNDAQEERVGERRLGREELIDLLQRRHDGLHIVAAVVSVEGEVASGKQGGQISRHEI